MSIILEKEHTDFSELLPEIQHTLAEWQLINIKLAADADEAYTIHTIGVLVQIHFKDEEGRICICNDHELIMLIRQGKDADLDSLTLGIKSALPEGLCTIYTENLSAENISKLPMSAKTGKVHKPLDSAQKRKIRTENMLLIADDDQYMRMLVKKGVSGYNVHEIGDGSAVLSAYKQYSPDIIFLDIHMPGKDGLENLKAILAYDPKAYVIMLSSDSSSENVLQATKNGAKGFLAKPLVKEKLLKYVRKCPTLIQKINPAFLK